MTDGTTGAAAEGDAPAAKPRQPRRKGASAGKAMAKAEALSVAGAAALVELAGLQRQVGQLVQGLTAMQDVQAVHTDMLRALLTAATAPTDPESPVADVLQQISMQLTDHSLQFREFRSALTRLPGDVALAVGTQMAAALDAVR